MKNQREFNENEIQLFKEAAEFLKELYPDVEFKEVLAGYTMSVAESSKSWHMSDKRIIISTKRDRVHWYRRRAVGYFTKPAGLKVPDGFAMKSAMVHEITHAIQKFQGRIPSEIETTQNEFHLLNKEHPELIKQLLKYKPRGFKDGTKVLFNGEEQTIKQAFLKPIDNYSPWSYTTNGYKNVPQSQLKAIEVIEENVEETETVEN